MKKNLSKYKILGRFSVIEFMVMLGCFALILTLILDYVM